VSDHEERTMHPHFTNAIARQRMQHRLDEAERHRRRSAARGQDEQAGRSRTRSRLRRPNPDE
jgi:hypothetical protein